jgi:branched-chain amino acid transport system substrate-binding protein
MNSATHGTRVCPAAVTLLLARAPFRAKWAAVIASLSMLFGSPAHADITVGVILSLTGPGASLGSPANETVKLWPHEVAGQKLNVIVLDDGSDPTRATIAARKLVTEDHVDILVGSSITPPSIAVMNVAGETSTALFSLAGGGAIIDPPTGPRHWAFKLSPPESIAVALAADDMKRRKVSTIGILAFANSYGDGFSKAMQAQAAGKGLTVVGVEQYSQTDQSTVGQVAKLMAAKPDAIYVAAAGTPGALPELDLAARGYKGFIYQTQGVANQDFLRVGGKALEGTFVTLSPMMVAEQLAPGNPVRNVAVDFVKRYEAQNGPDSRSPFAATAWDFMLVLQSVAPHALDVAKPGTAEFRSALRDGIESLKGFVAAEGIVNMTPNDHNGVDQSCQVLVRVEGGTWKLVQ